MDSRLIFLRRLQRFDPHACGCPRQILRLDVEVDGVRTPGGRGAPGRKGVSRKGEGIYDPEVLGGLVKKSRRRTRRVPVLKLTQVGEMNILRRSRERS